MVDKLERKLLNEIYTTVNPHDRRYPTDKVSHVPFYRKKPFYNYHEQIESLIKKGLLEVKTIYPFKDSLSIKLKVFDVSEKGMKHVKNSSKHYRDLKERQKEKLLEKVERRKHINNYEEYNTKYIPFTSKLTNDGQKVICTKCYTINKPCEHGKTYLKQLPPTARPPKANASKKRWKDFIERFNIY